MASIERGELSVERIGEHWMAANAEMLGDAPARDALAARASELAAGEYSWETVARQTLALYERLREA